LPRKSKSAPVAATRSRRSTGSLGGERESIEAVQLGTQELAFSSTGPVPNFVPEAKHPGHPLPVP
jgi:TRAP-type C4-dicarboxylate transport system substrate-binding protein